VHLVLYNAFGEELLHMTFDGQNSAKENWMSLDRLTYTSYTDIISPNQFSIIGNNQYHRRFLSTKKVQGVMTNLVGLLWSWATLAVGNEHQVIDQRFFTVSWTLWQLGATLKVNME
jgi:hypothetical protein